MAALWNIPVATNIATADMIISSPLLAGDYVATRPGFAVEIAEFTPRPVVRPDGGCRAACVVPGQCATRGDSWV